MSKLAILLEMMYSFTLNFITQKPLLHII